MTTEVQIAVDPDQIQRFQGVVFKHASPENFVRIAVFSDANSKDAHGQSFPLSNVIGRVTRIAQKVAADDPGFTVASPLSTFLGTERADAATIAQGLVVTVDLDQADPRVALPKLIALLGPPTIIVATGGTWSDPVSGMTLDRQHLHWRLADPTTNPADHARLKEARKLAAGLVGADPSMAPVVHPCRWPGTVWAKQQPRRLARIVEVNDAAEIDLDEALAALRAASGVAPPQGERAPPNASPEPGEGFLTNLALAARGGASDVIAALDVIDNPDFGYQDWTKVILASHAACMADPAVLPALRAWSAKAPKYQGREHRDATDRAWKDAVKRAATDQFTGEKAGWRTLMKLARESVPGWTPPSERKDAAEHLVRPTGGAAWPEPADLLSEDELPPAPVLRPELLPEAIRGHVFDIAARVGVDPTTVALCDIVVCASVMSDAWRLQPKIHDNGWTECPRLWGAIVGDPSIRKSPVLAASTAPLDMLDKRARETHQDAMLDWKAQAIASKAPEKFWPPKPKLARYMVEGTTVEALTELLRSDLDARFYVPAGKVLVRQDEMTGWIGDFDRYKAGGKGGSDRAHYLRLYNGGRYSIDRIGRGAFATPSWSACILGGIQPEPLRRIADEGEDDGLLQRFLLIVPSGDHTGVDRVPDDEALARYTRLVETLAVMKPPSRQVVVLHPDAHKHRHAINELIRVHMAAPSASPRLKSTLGKWEAVYARLLLIWKLIEVADVQPDQFGDGSPFIPSADVRDPMVVDEATAGRVADFLREILMPHLLRADAVLFGSQQAVHARWIAGHILASGEARTSGRVTARGLQKSYRALGTPEKRKVLEAVMDGLEAAGWVRAEVPKFGRPITTWQVNPAIYSRFADKARAERTRRNEAQAAVTEAARKSRRRVPATIGRSSLGNRYQ